MILKNVSCAKQNYIGMSRERVAGLAALILFVWLACEVTAGRTEAFDQAVRNAVHAHASPAATLFLRGATLIGSWMVLVPLGVFLAVWWARSGRARTMARFAIIALGAELLEQLLKLAFHRPRPVPFFGLATPAGHSFPSGHAVLAVCFYGALATLVAWQPRWAVWTGTVLLAAAIGFSRVYLGVHYPTDVVGGYAAGVVWFAAVQATFSRGLPRRFPVSSGGPRCRPFRAG